MDSFVVVGGCVFVFICAVWVTLCMRQANKSADRAVEMADSVDLDARSVDSAYKRAKGLVDEMGRGMGRVNEMVSAVALDSERTHQSAELVVTEVAGLKSYIDKLNKDRADYPPAVLFQYHPETGEPTGAIVPGHGEYQNKEGE